MGSSIARQLSAASHRTVAAAALVDHYGLTVHHHHLPAECLLQVLLAEDLRGAPGADKPPVQQDHLVEPPRGQIKIVGRDKDRHRAGAQSGQELQGSLASAHVHSRERLVEKKHMRLLHQRPGEKRPLLLSA